MENVNDSNTINLEESPNKKNRKKSERNNKKKDKNIYNKKNTDNLEMNILNKYELWEDKTNLCNEKNITTNDSEVISKNSFKVRSTNLSNEKIIKDEDDKNITNIKLGNFLESSNVNEKDNLYGKNENKNGISKNAEVVVEPLEFQKKLKKWKETEFLLKEKKDDEKKFKEKRQLQIENIKYVHSIKKEEVLLEKKYLEQIKKDEELAKQLEYELNSEIRNELKQIEDEGFKLANIIQESINCDITEENNNRNIDQNKTHNIKVSKLKTLKEKFKNFFKKKSSK